VSLSTKIAMDPDVALLDAGTFATQIRQCVTDSTWMVRRGYEDVAREMRDEFLREWEFPTEWWNDAVDEFIEYVQRKGETPEVSTQHLLAVRL
jgi:hypothetical protein